MDEVEKIVVETSRYGDRWNFYHQKQRSDGEPITEDYIASVPIPGGIGAYEKLDIHNTLSGLCVFDKIEGRSVAHHIYGQVLAERIAAAFEELMP